MKHLAARAVLVAIGVAALIIALTLRLYVWPTAAATATVDAVVVLAGGSGERLPTGERLVRRGVASVLVISTGAVGRSCSDGGMFEVTCFAPDPATTRGEARAIGRLAREQRWNRLAVVTSTYHVTRAGALIRQCYDGDVHMVDAGSGLTGLRAVYAIAREWLGLVAGFTVARAC